MQSSGAYRADRASALSGVPKSTIHYWARTGVLVPGVSAEKVKLWSYADLMGLRVIYWLRQHKTDDLGAEIPATSMGMIRLALRRLRELAEPLWHPERESIWVARDGQIHVQGPSGPETLSGQSLVPESINLIAPFKTREGTCGPDLARPRPEIRIVPGRLSGSPHIVHTRLETRAVYALHRDGLSPDAIRALYPYVNENQIADAIALEQQLEDNLAVRAAA